MTAASIQTSQNQQRPSGKPGQENSEDPVKYGVAAWNVQDWTIQNNSDMELK